MEFYQNRPNQIFKVTLIGIGLISVAIVLVGTRWGPWAYSDGVGYMVSARNLAQGIGLGLVLPSGEFEPLVSHPPLFPLLIALLSKLGFGLQTSARIINMLSFAAFILGSGLLVSLITQNRLIGLIYSSILMLTPNLVLLFLSAMAEPVSFSLGFPGLYLMVRYRQTARQHLLLLSAAMIGLAALARYPALSMVVAGVVFIILTPKSIRLKFVDTVRFLSVSLLPLAIFFLWSRIVQNAGTPREFATSGSSTASIASFIRQSLQVVWSWKPIPSKSAINALFGTDLATWLPLGLAILISCSFLILMIGTAFDRRIPHAKLQLNKRLDHLASISIIYILSYLILIAFAYLGTYPTPDIDFRTLLPLLPSLLLLALLTLSFLQRWKGRKLLQKAGYSGVVIGLLLGYSTSTAELIRGHFRTGAGYTGRYWQSSSTLEAVFELPGTIPLISNQPEAILLYLNRYPYDLSSLIGNKNDKKEKCPEPFTRMMEDEDATIVFFTLPGDPSQTLPDPKNRINDIITICGYNIQASFVDGFIIDSK